MKLTIPKQNIEIEGTVEEIKSLVVSLLGKGNVNKQVAPVVSTPKRKRYSFYGQRGVCYGCNQPAKNYLSNMCGNDACKKVLDKARSLKNGAQKYPTKEQKEKGTGFPF